MKNVLWLICILSLSYSCKQTQLTSNYIKRPNKIFTKAPSNFNDFYIASNENRASVPAKPSSIKKSVEKQLYSVEKINKNELYTDFERRKILKDTLDNFIHKRSVKLDSILKLNLKSKSDNKILDLSKKAKKYSLISITNLSLTAPLTYISLLTGSIKPGFEILSLLFGISTFIFSTISLFFLKKSIKEIKKSSKDYKETEKTIKKNLRIAIFCVFLCLIPIFLVASALIWVACCFSF